eukprot:2996216-Pyramimonas_sp.AAC.1
MDILEARLDALEEDTDSSMQGATGLSQRADRVIKLENTVANIEESLKKLAERPPAAVEYPPGSRRRLRSPESTRSTTASSSVWAPAARSGNQPEGACRLVLLGFPRPMMASTLRRAAEQVRNQAMPIADHNKCIVKAFDMNRKAVFEFGDALTATNFLSNFNQGTTFVDPRG